MPGQTGKVHRQKFGEYMTRKAIGRPSARLAQLLSVAFVAAVRTSAQAPEGPMVPPPTVTIQQAPPRAVLKVQVTLVNTPVVVRNAKDEMVHNLDAKDFQVTDNGVRQQITHFDLGSDPVSMVVLVETSSRISALLPQVRKTGILLTQTVMGPTGEAAILSFNDGIDKLQDFTSNSDFIESTMSQLPEGTSGAKLYDAMAVGVEMLTSRRQKNTEKSANRRVLMILAEASDEGSVSKLGEVLRKAQLANVTIYSVGLSTTRSELQAKHPPETQTPITPPGTFGRPPFPGSIQTPDTAADAQGVDITALAVWAVQHAENVVKGQALEAAAAATGGVHISTFRDRSIENAIDEIGGELHSQYNLSYSPTDATSSGYHEITVTVDKQNLKVRARPGYYLP
jgi:VWFA-related protein